MPAHFRCEGLPFLPFTVCFRRVKASKRKPSHSKLLKINDKPPPCEGVNAFFGNINTYTRARGTTIHAPPFTPSPPFTATPCKPQNSRAPQGANPPLLHLSFRPNQQLEDLRFTSPGLFFSNRRVEKTTPGLFSTSPRTAFPKRERTTPKKAIP